LKLAVVELEELQDHLLQDQQVIIQFLDQLHPMVVAVVVEFIQILEALEKMERMVHQVVEVQNLIQMFHLQQVVDQETVLPQVLRKALMVEVVELMQLEVAAVQVVQVELQVRVDQVVMEVQVQVHGQVIVQ
jgi:hypothetical protein